MTWQGTHQAFQDAFDDEVFQEVTKTGVTLDRWRAGGRVSKAFPNKEDGTWWAAHGPEMVQAWVDWRAATPWAVLVTEAGQPAIELELHPVILGVPVRMFIDRVFVDLTSGEACIVDLKTGSRTPDSDLQLGFYKVGLQKVLGLEVNQGAYWMARSGQLSPLMDLSRYDEGLIGNMLVQFNKAVANEIFLPHVSSSCRTCGVNRACAAFGGAEAHLYDPLHAHYTPDIKRSTDG